MRTGRTPIFQSPAFGVSSSKSSGGRSYRTLSILALHMMSRFWYSFTSLQRTLWDTSFHKAGIPACQGRYYLRRGVPFRQQFPALSVFIPEPVTKWDRQVTYGIVCQNRKWQQDIYFTIQLVSFKRIQICIQRCIWNFWKHMPVCKMYRAENIQCQYENDNKEECPSRGFCGVRKIFIIIRFQSVQDRNFDI